PPLVPFHLTEEVAPMYASPQSQQMNPETDVLHLTIHRRQYPENTDRFAEQPEIEFAREPCMPLCPLSLVNPLYFHSVNFELPEQSQNRSPTLRCGGLKAYSPA